MRLARLTVPTSISTKLLAGTLLVMVSAACNPAPEPKLEEPVNEQPIRVIVTLELRGEASAVAFEAARGDVLSLLDDGSFSVIREYPRTGQLLLEMQPRDLQRLETAPGIRSVSKDRLLTPYEPPQEER